MHIEWNDSISSRQPESGIGAAEKHIVRVVVVITFHRVPAGPVLFKHDASARSATREMSVRERRRQCHGPRSPSCLEMPWPLSRPMPMARVAMTMVRRSRHREILQNRAQFLTRDALLPTLHEVPLGIASSPCGLLSSQISRTG